MGRRVLRCCDDDLGIYKLLLKHRIWALLVRSRHEGVALFLNPFAESKLVLCCAQQAGLLLGVLAALKYLVSLVLELPVLGILTSYKHIKTLPRRLAEAVSIRN